MKTLPYSKARKLKPESAAARDFLQRIEVEAATEVRLAVEAAVGRYIDKLKAAGHPVQELAPMEFMARNYGADTALKLSFNAAIGVAAKLEEPELVPPPIDGVIETFYLRADDAFQRAEKKGFESLDAKQRLVLVVRDLETEMNNGGFHQYFSNTGGDHAVEALEALDEIGARGIRSVLSDAITLFEGGPHPNRNKRQKQMEAFTPKQRKALAQLDEAFYEIDENLAALAMAHLTRS